MISFLCGKSHINGREKLGTMMPCTTHVISFLYGKSHINSPKNIGTMMPFFLLHPTSVETAKTFINELRSSATGNQFRLECVTTPPAAARTRSSSLPISYKARRSHSSPSETAPRWSSSNLAADASSTYGIEHTATTKQPSSYNLAPCDKHSTSVTKTTPVKTHFWLNPTSVEGSKTFINELRSSATGSQFLVGIVSTTPPAAARTRSSSLAISDKERLSHSLPCETAPRRSSSNLAADASSTYTASDTLPPQNNNHPTTLHHATNIQIRSQQQLRSKQIFGWTQPPWRVPRLSLTSCAALLQATNSGWNVSPHHPQQPGLEAHVFWYFRQRTTGATPCPVKQLLSEVLPIWQPMPRPPTASDTLPPQNNNHPTTSHHVTKTCNFLHNLFLPHRTCVGGAKTSSNRARSSPTAGHLLSDPRPTFRAFAILRSSITEISARASWSHSRPLVTALLRSSCNRISTALDDADDAVACSIRTDIPFSKWNSDHKTSTDVTGARLEPNILHSEIPRHAYLFANP